MVLYVAEGGEEHAQGTGGTLPRQHQSQREAVHQKHGVQRGHKYGFQKRERVDRDDFRQEAGGKAVRGFDEGSRRGQQHYSSRKFHRGLPLGGKDGRRDHGQG